MAEPTERDRERARMLGVLIEQFANAQNYLDPSRAPTMREVDEFRASCWQTKKVASLRAQLEEARRERRTPGTVETCPECGYWNEGGTICVHEYCPLRASKDQPTPQEKQS